jgi:hypothetical protein
VEPCRSKAAQFEVRLAWRHIYISVKKKILPGAAMAAMGSWLTKGIDMTACRHGALNKRATNKSIVRSRATNENGRGQGRAISGEKWAVNRFLMIRLRLLSRLVDSVNLSAKLREGRPLFNVSDRVLRPFALSSSFLISHCMR